MISAIMILFFLPWLDTSKVRSATFRPIYKKIYWLLIVDLIILTWVGGNAPEGNFIIIGRISKAAQKANNIIAEDLSKILNK